MTPGKKVKVYNQTPSGKKILEGKATLVKRWTDHRDSEDGRHEYWQVKFEDGSVADRWVEVQ